MKDQGRAHISLYSSRALLACLWTVPGFTYGILLFILTDQKVECFMKTISIKPGLQADNNFYKRGLRFAIC